MWFNRDLFQRLEQLKARHMENSEFTAKELNSVRKRILTLEQQVNYLMNENVDLISHLRVLENKLSPKEKELKIYRDEERGGYVLKEKEEDWTLLPRLGDLVVNIENGNDIRRVFENHYGFMFVGKDYRTIYARNQLKDSLKEWKVIARKVDLK